MVSVHKILKNFLVQNYCTEFLDIALEKSLASLLFSSPVGSLCHSPGVVHVRRVSPVSTIATRNKDIKSIFAANVHHLSSWVPTRYRWRILFVVHRLWCVICVITRNN